ncbi:uncharacterized protein ATNIH1004_001660 [Aspergillus tanneri]|uniref:C2H2 type master regulator of conidiophore development brlA n=2 Tax=Aspergillus tanneri TaxID=1220188 RepID=A0A5M9N077_9EURO|nr:uncharacterized protein ATNIH1004_001660 [Aspergillus tanneri]KAA8652755.1 hypothetical protein ATNIH1004_001660 [Aspergillus tanneri]
MSKAFSDSSSLARHRRVHTGKQLYICQEPTCERSFCSKTALAKHHRSHPLSTTTRPTLEDAISKHSYQNPISTSVANNQSLLAQKSYYSHSFTPTHEFYPPKNIPMTRPAGVQEAPPVIANNVPVPSPVDVQHVRQQYMQQLMQQRYDQGRPGYAPPEFLHLFAGVPTTEGHGLMVTYPQNFQGKQ